MRLGGPAMLRTSPGLLLVDAVSVPYFAESLKRLDTLIRRGSYPPRCAFAGTAERNPSGTRSFNANLMKREFVMQGGQNP